jgi:ecotin
MKTLLSIALLMFVSTSTNAADYMKAFPPAAPGMIRYMISLPPLEDESAIKVELVVGKTVNVDERNRYFFGAKLEKETIRGWGFDRYILRKLGPIASTLVAIDPNAPKVDRFVTLSGEPRLVGYNSRLPLVVYVPTGVEVRYRLWRADPNATTAQQG